MPHIRIVIVGPKFEGNVGAIARSMANFGLDDLVPHLNGTTALAASKEESVAPAKVISEFIKKNKLADAGILAVKVGLVDGDKKTHREADRKKQ